MSKTYNNLNEQSTGFVMCINEQGVMMDVKQVLLNHEGRQKMFKWHHVLYLMIINASAGKKIQLDADFVNFLVLNTFASRASLFKYVKVLTDSGFLTKLEKRGWYKINNIEKQIIEA